MVKKRAKKGVKKRQWSNLNNILVLLALIVLIVVIKTSLAPSLTLDLPGEVNNDLAREADIVLGKFTDEKTRVSLTDSNGLVEEKVVELERMDYNEMKEMLGIENDFCLFFEDITGDLVKVNGMGQGIGSDKIYIDGKPCE